MKIDRGQDQLPLQSVPESQIREALDGIVASGLPLMSIACALLFGVFAVSHMLLLPASVASTLAGMAVGSSVAMLVGAWLMRSTRRWNAHTAAAALALLMLVNALVHLRLTREAHQTTNLMLIMLGCGVFFLSVRWLAIVLTAAVIGWIAVAMQAPWSGEWTHFGFAMFTATVLAATVHGARMSVTRRAEALRILEAGKQRALESSEASFAAIVAKNPDAILLTDAAGALLYASPSGKALLDRLNEEQRAALLREAAHAGHSAEVPIVRVLGGPGTAEINVIDTEWEGRPACLSWVRDVTDRRRVEEELVQAQKLESIGLLAGGIAHDFNNVLTGILGNIRLAQRDAAEGSRARERLSDAEKAAWRARDLTHQLLTFSRGGEPVKKTLSLAPLVREAADFAISGSRARNSFAWDDELWPVEADEGQFRQVVNNLVLNAVQAMPEGGVIDIRAANVPGDDAGSEPCVRLTFEDHGVGIAPEDLPRVFDPFFTTRQGGHGLGLATTYSIVRRHKGHIEIRSEPGRGTTVVVTVPAAPSALAVPSPSPSAPARGRGSVLLMDDEDLILESTGPLLRECGYTVTCVSDGAGAVEAFREARRKGQPFDVVVMDLTIPGGMGGEQTLPLLKQIDPEVKAIVSSGYSSVMADHEKHGFRDVVEKPYVIGDLVETIKRVMKD